MEIKKTDFNGLFIIKPDVFTDERGYFMEWYNQKRFESFLNLTFVQDNESLSKQNVLRGLHFQHPPYAQAKLVRVLTGKILDIAVDLRKNEPTFGKYFKYKLDAVKKELLFIPEGFAHGFLSLADQTIIQYKCNNFYRKSAEDALLWNDPDLNIDWETDAPILSEKDRQADLFRNFESPF